MTAHLAKDAVFTACGQSAATFLGEQGQKDTCKYYFKVGAEKESDTWVELYTPAQKAPPAEPQDPFFEWKKVGRTFVTNKAKSPKSQPMLLTNTGLWMPGKDYVVSVNVSTRVCTKAQAMKLATKLK